MTGRIHLGLTAMLVAVAGFVIVSNVSAQEEVGRVKVKMPNVRAVSGYLKIGDIKGESTDEAHEDWIDVLSIDWGGADPGVAADRARQPQEVVIVREMDKASPKIFEKIATGEHIPAIELDAVGERVEGGNSQPYQRYKLERVIITSYSVDASGDVPTETITLNYEKIDRVPDVILKGKKVLEN